MIMTWLTIFDNGMWHVVPADEEGNPKEDHVPNPDCPCEPELEFTYDEETEEAVGLTLIHNQIH